MGIRGIGITKSQAFEQAALALTAVITNPQGVAPEVERHFSCKAPDDELLLVDWLNALIYEMAGIWYFASLTSRSMIIFWKPSLAGNQSIA